jgi:carboxymethylenebutenolidase
MSARGDWEKVGDSGVEAYVVRPPASNGHAIVLLQEILGPNATMRNTASEMAQEGYTVAVPDLYWRMQRRVDLGYDKPQVEVAFSFSKRLDDKLAVEDIAATVAHLKTIDDVRFVHLMGFCLGGRLAVLGAQAANVTSAVSLYGVGIERHLDFLAGAKCPLQLHYGDRDRWVPNTAVETVTQASKGRDIEIHVYPGINHGFFPRTRLPEPLVPIHGIRIEDCFARGEFARVR